MRHCLSFVGPGFLAPKGVRAAASVLSVILGVVYPLVLWYALTHFSARVTGLVAIAFLLPLFALRAFSSSRENLARILALPSGVLALVAIGALLNDERFFFALPVLINGFLFLGFLMTLRSTPMIERFARLQEPELSTEKCAHCRQATWAWIAFFFVNGTIAGLLALSAPLHFWATYTGGIAYALMGLMFAGEYILRKIRFREYSRFPHDRALALLFPPQVQSDTSSELDDAF